MEMNDTAHPGFWNSWMGKLIALSGLIWIAPTDEIFTELVEPGWSNLKKRARNGWGHAIGAGEVASAWLKKMAWRLLMLTILVGAISGALTFVGLAQGSRALIVGGGLLWVTYLIVLWILIKMSVHTVAKAIEITGDLTGSTFHAVAKKVGLTDAYRERFEIDGEKINDTLSKGFPLLPVFAEGFAALALLPSWGTLLLGGIVTLVVIASGLISAHINDDTTAGWLLVKKVNFWIAVVLATIAVLTFFLPNSFGKWVDAGALDAWIANPTWSLGWFGSVVAIAAIGLVAWIVAGRFEGESGKRFSGIIPVITVIAMVLTGMHLSGADDKAADAAKSTYRSIVDDGQTAKSQSASYGPHTVPTTGGTNTMTMPQVDYKTGGEPTKRTVAKKSASSPKRASKPTPEVEIPEVRVEKKRNGFDKVRQNTAEIEALLSLK